MSKKVSQPESKIKAASNDQTEALAVSVGSPKKSLQSREQLKRLLLQLQQGNEVHPCESWRRRKDGLEIKVCVAIPKQFDEVGESASLANSEHELP